MSPSSPSAAAFGAHYSMESPNTRDNKEKLMAQQISPNTCSMQSSLMEQAFNSQGLPSPAPMSAKNEGSSHWIDFSADNDFQKMENMFAQQQQQYSDTSSIPMGSNVDLGESLTEQLDYDVNLDSELVDDEQALALMKELLGGKVSSRSKQVLLAAAAITKSPLPGTLNQRLVTMSDSISPKPPRHLNNVGSDPGDVSIHSDSRRGSITNCTATTFMSSFGSGMSLSVENNNETTAAAVETAAAPTKEKKKSSSGGKSSRKKSSSKGKESSSTSDRKSKDKKKKKRSSKNKEFDDTDAGAGDYSAYLPLDDDGSAIVEDGVCPDGSIRFGDTTLNNNNNKQLSSEHKNGDSLVNFLHTSLTIM